MRKINVGFSLFKHLNNCIEHTFNNISASVIAVKHGSKSKIWSDLSLKFPLNLFREDDISNFAKLFLPFIQVWKTD